MLEGLFYVDQDEIQNVLANAYIHTNKYGCIYIYKCVTYIYICIHIYVCVCISPQILNSILVYIKQTFQHKTSTTGAA